MIYDLRTYTLLPGKVAEAMALYQAEGWPELSKWKQNLIGYFVSDIGSLNQVVHLWAYEGLDQRDKCRAAMQADPAWQTYLAKNRPLMVSQETRLMKCAPFFLERLKKMLAAK